MIYSNYDGYTSKVSICCIILKNSLVDVVYIHVFVYVDVFISYYTIKLSIPAVFPDFPLIFLSIPSVFTEYSLSISSVFNDYVNNCNSGQYPE